MLMKSSLQAILLMAVSTVVATASANLIPNKYASDNTIIPKNVIGFFQSYDAPNAWYFNDTQDELAKSGYTVLIDAFWTNYPFCWGDGSTIPGSGNPIASCSGIVNQPGPATNNTIDTNFWRGYHGQSYPTVAGDAYTHYWTSLHTTGPQVIAKLREKIDELSNHTISHQKIRLLASIGGWNMGGSAAGKPNTPAYPQLPAWKLMLQDPQAFANAMHEIVNLKVTDEHGVSHQLYDGLDIDIETLYGLGCDPAKCSDVDKNATVDALVQAIEIFKSLSPNAVLSTSPRASDIYCPKLECNWNSENGLGFFGEVLSKLAIDGYHFDMINPQFYNENSERNIPNGKVGNKLSIGAGVKDVLAAMTKYDIVGPHQSGTTAYTSLNIGVLSQTNGRDVDTGGASKDCNPGVAKSDLPALWQQINADQSLTNEAHIDGVMTWSANLALHGVGIGGNVRSTGTSHSRDVVPSDWPADLFTKSKQ